MDPWKPLRSLAGNERILVVDDDPDIVRFLEVNFRSVGYEVHVAFDGEEGLEKTRALIPDLVTLGVMMPRIDGWEVARRVRADPGLDGVAIIMITAKALPTDKVLGLAVGADDYILKPFNPLDVLARVRGTLDRYAESDTDRPFYGRALATPEEVDRYLTGRAIADNLRAGHCISMGSSRRYQGLELEVMRGVLDMPDDPRDRANHVRYQLDNALRLEGVPLWDADREMHAAEEGEAELARVLQERPGQGLLMGLGEV